MKLIEETNFAVTAVREAAQIVLAVYGRDFDVDLKAQREPVTQADRRANALLVNRFSTAFPNDGIVAEESLPSDEGTLLEAVSKRRIWFIDPLDGTKEFIARNGEFSVMIGLAIAGRPALGVVATPATGDVAVGEVGVGAWMLSSNGDKKPLRVSAQKDLHQSKIIVSRSHMSDRLAEVVDTLAPASCLRSGSVGVKTLRIAQRVADFYVNLHAPGGAKLWDGCAPEAIMLGAGGMVTDASGNPINYATTTLELTGGYVATNGHLHEAVIDVTRKFA